MSSSRVENIFIRYSSALRGFISKRLSSDIESEDMLHDVFYKFIVSDGEDESIENVSAWLYRVARNMVVDSSRKKREESMPYIAKVSGGELLEIPLSELLSTEGDTPETELVNSLIREELMLALEELPAKQRAVFELNELQGFSFKEISEASAEPINTLISQKRYAVQHLRRRLAELYCDVIEG